jgi:hypothetical protein
MGGTSVADPAGGGGGSMGAGYHGKLSDSFCGCMPRRAQDTEREGEINMNIGLPVAFVQKSEKASSRTCLSLRVVGRLPPRMKDPKAWMKKAKYSSCQYRFRSTLTWSRRVMNELPIF